MVEYVTLVNVGNRLFDDGCTMKELYIESGIEFTEYRNKVFVKAYEFIKDKNGQVGLKAGIIYMKHKF